VALAAHVVEEDARSEAVVLAARDTPASAVDRRQAQIAGGRHRDKDRDRVPMTSGRMSRGRSSHKRRGRPLGAARISCYHT